MGPVKGANGVYMVQVDSKAKHDVDNATVTNQLTQGYRNKVRQITDVLRLKADIKDTRNEHF